MFFQQIKDPRLAQYAYIVGSRESGEALIIDPQRDVDRYIDLAESKGLRITAVTETHIHADFLSGARAPTWCIPAARWCPSGATPA